MRSAAEVYGIKTYEPFDAPGDYDPMIEEFGKVALRADAGDYSGDTYVLYWDELVDDGPHRFGYLCFGWGSCSGCDALQGCGSLKDLQDLMDDLWKDTKWFPTATEALKFFEEHDWGGDYHSGDSNMAKFVEDAKKLISEKADDEFIASRPRKSRFNMARGQE